MGLLTTFNRFAGARFGFMLKRVDGLYEWQRHVVQSEAPGETNLPAESIDYLRPDNPRLLELERRYAAFDPAVTTPARWTKGFVDTKILRNFRGDSPYVWQDPGLYSGEISYALSYLALKSGSTGPVLDALGEDGLFGARTFSLDGRLVSRDLLDSVREIEFLQRHAGLGLTAKSVLDIGAGYGRLAHRIGEVSPETTVFATDAFPQSTFLAEYYLGFRKAERAVVIPLDEIDRFLDSNAIDVATNIHSFSECTTEAIAWWVSRLAKHKVRHLMLVPNGEARNGPIGCQTDSGEDIDAILGRFGYRLKVREPRYQDPLVQRYALDPAQLYLFELT